MEEGIKVYDTGRKDKAGNDIYNVYLKTMVDKTTGDIKVGLKPNQTIIMEKIFAEGYENKKGTYSFFSCKAKYQDKEVSFLLFEKDHDSFKEAGGIGDEFSVTLTPYEYKFDNESKKANKLVFAKV